MEWIILFSDRKLNKAIDKVNQYIRINCDSVSLVYFTVYRSWFTYYILCFFEKVEVLDELKV